MFDALAYLLADAFANGNTVAVANLLDLARDPAELARAAGVPAESFADWRAGVSSTGEAGWISTGGEFRKVKPAGAGVSEDATHKQAGADVANAVVATLANDPDVKGKPGLLAKVKDAAVTAGAAVMLAAFKVQDHWTGKVVGELIDAYFDNPKDMGKLGYNPSNTAGTAHPRVQDNVSSAVADLAGFGLSGHLVAKIAAEVLSRGLLFLRDKFRGAKMADDQGGDKATAVAAVLAQMFDAVNESLGLSGRHDPAAVANAIRALVAGGPPAPKMADDAPPARVAAVPIKAPVIQTGRRAAPATGEVALAGPDGAKLAKLVGQSKAFGVATVARLVGGSIQRYKGFGSLLNAGEVKQMADALAAVNGTADQLGRTRTRELHDRATVFKAYDRPPDVPFATFADELPGVIATPEAAAAYFTSRRPELGTDPKRFGEDMRRTAFTLAVSSNQVLTERVQQIIGNAMRTVRNTADAQAAIRKALEAAGVSPKNPQYSEMVFRTNAMDSYQQGMYEEGKHPDVEDAFPVWEYLGIDDGRAGEDHKPHFGKYYPRSRSFHSVRGERVYNCRCSLGWVDHFEWDKLRAAGKEEER